MTVWKTGRKTGREGHLLCLSEGVRFSDESAHKDDATAVTGEDEAPSGVNDKAGDILHVQRHVLSHMAHWRKVLQANKAIGKP